jgi:hypothetical protein
MVKKMESELWSIKERIVYREENTIAKAMDGVFILCTPTGEPLVNRVK